MATKSTTTARDLAAAVKLGVIAPDAVLVTAADAEALAAEARNAAESEAAGRIRAAAEAAAAATPTGDHHQCALTGCRHGDMHLPGYVPQRDRQLKLVAPCGAVIRLTGTALARAGGEVKCGHGDPFAVDTTRRQYNRKAQ